MIFWVYVRSIRHFIYERRLAFNHNLCRGLIDQCGRKRPNGDDANNGQKEGNNRPFPLSYDVEIVS